MRDKLAEIEERKMKEIKEGKYLQKYPFNMSKKQWLKWVACEAMKGLISTQMFTQASIIENAHEMADAFLKEGEKDE